MPRTNPYPVFRVPWFGRDKYMFHQANVIPTSLSGGSLLAHWYEEVMAVLTSFIAFPVTVSFVLFCFVFGFVSFLVSFLFVFGFASFRFVPFVPLI